MTKSRTNVIVGIILIFIMLIAFLITFPRVFVGSAIQFWSILVLMILGMVYLASNVYYGYLAEINNEGITVYNYFIRTQIYWAEIDNCINFENYSFKFKVRGKRYTVPLFFYKKPEETIKLILNKLKEYRKS